MKIIERNRTYFAMDAEVMEYLDLLKNNVSELCSLGKQWGMTEAEVSSCINEVIDKSGYIPETRVTTKSVCRKIWWTIRCSRKIGFVMLMILWIAICVVGLVMAVSSYNEDVGNVISKTLQPYGYDIFRYLRLAALPLHGVFNITRKTPSPPNHKQCTVMAHKQCAMMAHKQCTMAEHKQWTMTSHKQLP